MTPSSRLASTSAQGGRGAPRSGCAGAGFGRTDNLEVVPLVARRVVAGVLAFVAAGLELVHHLVEVVADVLAELLPHLPHPARHGLRILLVEAVEGRRIGEVV